MLPFLRFQLVLFCVSLSLMAKAQTLPAPTHIVVVIMENHAAAQIIGSEYTPHLKNLCDDPHCAVFSLSHGVEHPSQPNYLDLFSGNNQGVTDDDVPTNYPFTTPNLAAELISASKSFATFSEGLPEAGYDGARFASAAGRYARKHNPAANWIAKNKAGASQLPASVNQPLSAFPGSDFSSLPTVSFVIPTLNYDMHDGTYPANVVAADQWLNNNIDAYRKWTLTHNAMLIITFDEDDGFHDNVIPTIFYGPMLRGGTYGENINHFSVLRTIEDMYGLGHAGKSAEAAAILDCWTR